MVKILKVFKTGEPPVDPKETLELFVFPEAVGESRRRNGAAVPIVDIFTLAEAESQKRMDKRRIAKK